MAINRLLTDKDRENYKALIDDMFRVCPEVMKRKIPRANIQQAFVLGEVLKLLPTHTNVLSVGCYDDTAYEYLLNLSYKSMNIIGIDPAINVDLKTFKSINHDKFDIIFSTSVLEHVPNDEEFVDDICKLLSHNGVGILTMDFNDEYRVGDRLPQTDVRFYTKKDLEFRLTKILTDNGCDLVDVPDWSGEPEFTHDGCNYSFATFVFRKMRDV
jgi:SAM-dependent methyltransferase